MLGWRKCYDFSPLIYGCFSSFDSQAISRAVLLCLFYHTGCRLVSVLPTSAHDGRCLTVGVSISVRVLVDR